MVTSFYQMWRKKNKPAHHAWRVDETYTKVKEKSDYLYRIIGSDRHTLDFQLRKTRNHQASYAFIKRLIKHLEYHQFYDRQATSFTLYI
nr:hypothetical protein GGBNIMDK_00121 [Bacillus cereus]